jgi:hypothetical protein
MEREFPSQFSLPLRKVLKAVSFNPFVVGSSADHQILYSADYDLLEEQVVKRSSAKSFQKKIRDCQKVGKIVDIKIGEITEWNLLKKPYINGKVVGYSQKDELANVANLWQKELITHDEFMQAQDLLKDHLTPIEFLQAQKALRFGLLRWSTTEVAQGYKELRNKKIITLEEAFKTKGITKIDLIAWITNKYVEVSNIILWTNRSGVVYAYIPNIKVALSADLLAYSAEGNYVKVAKRMLALAKKFKDSEIIETLTQILNSPIGNLYTVVADLQVLEEFPKAITQVRKRKQLDFMRDRFAKLYFPEFNKAIPNLDLLPKLEQVLQDEMEKALRSMKLLPIPRKYEI